MPDRKRKKPLVPKLRFPEFRDAGEWEERRIGDVYRFIPTNSLSREKLTYDSGRVRNIHYGDIHTKFRALFDIEKESLPFINDGISLKESNNDGFCVLGDVIFADASEDVDDIGKAIEIVNTGGQKIVCGLHTLHARQIAPEFIVGFSGYLFQSRGIRQQIRRESQGAKVLGISASRLATIRIFIPKQPEQQKIAACLSSLDELIELEAKKLESLKAHKKGLMQQLFPAEGETTPRLRFPEFQDAGEWEVKRLGEVAKVYQPETISQSKLKEHGEFFVYGANGIIGKLNRYNHKLPQVTVTCRGSTCGEVTLTKPCSWITGNSMVVNVDDSNDVVKLFIFYSLKNANLTYLITGSGQPQITGEIKKHKIYIPPLPEQHKIADCLSSLDEVIELEAKKLESLKAHKKGLMQQLFPQEVV